MRCCSSGQRLCRRGGAAPAVSGGNGLERLAQAVALYQGRFLGGFSLGDAPAFEEWQLLQRERLHRQALDALATLVERYTAQGAYEDALGYAWRQVELDPWREAAQRQLIHLLALTGERGAALRQYEVCCGILEEELGVEPDAADPRSDPGHSRRDIGRDGGRITPSRCHAGGRSLRRHLRRSRRRSCRCSVASSRWRSWMSVSGMPT